MYGYVFLVRPTMDDGPVIDSFLDVSKYLCDGEFVDMAKAMAVRVRLDKDDTEAKNWTKDFKSVVASISGMTLRARYNSGMEGPLLVKAEAPLTPEELERYIQCLSKDKRKQFFIDARL